ncbi:MAG: winged helix-turn-helix domain-containing protein [Prochloraceae cyanobacterium]|nr:winged helix-turn-helix domain-containing protein [Prochloraceae cyanobacterium]
MRDDFANWLNFAAANKALQGADLRVLLVLLSDSDQYFNSSITQTEIARRLKNNPQQVNRSIQNLETNGIIKRLKINHLTYGFKLAISTEES